MGKKRAVAAPVFPFPAAAGTDHFSDYGFDPHCFSQSETKRQSTRRQHHQQQPAPLESARFKLQKPISKKQHHQHNKKQQRRRWWSSAASAALLLFRRPSTSPSNNPNRTLGAARPASPYGSSSPAVPLYLADGDDGDATAACACWAPAMRSGHHLAAAELGAASASVPYVSLRNANLGRGAAPGGAAPAAMPIYLVT